MKKKIRRGKIKKRSQKSFCFHGMVDLVLPSLKQKSECQPTFEGLWGIHTCAEFFRIQIVKIISTF